MEEIKVKVEKFNDDFIEAVKNGEVKNVKYNVCNVKELKEGDYNFSFEMNDRKYVMTPEMRPYWAMKFIELFQRTAFKFIHKKQEKLNRLIKRFKKDHTLKNIFKKSFSSLYGVETMINAEDNVNRNTYNYYWDNDFTNVTDEDVINTFIFCWCNRPDDCSDEQKSYDEIYEIFEKNGGFRLYVDYNDYNFCGSSMFVDRDSYNGLNNLFGEQLERIRKIITETYFEEEEKNEEKS